MCRAIAMTKNFFSNRVVAPVLGALLVLGIAPGAALAAEGNLVSIIDFEKLAPKVQSLLETAIGAAAGVGAVVLAAVICWKFFRRFLQG